MVNDEFIDKKIGFIKRNIKNLQHYNNPEKLVDEIDKWIVELSYFYNKLVGDNDDPSKVIYNLSPHKRPIVGQMVYVNLRRGYPKETYDDHWCYVLKDFGTKFVVIPSVSIKPDSGKCNELYEMDIEDETPNGKSRLQITDIRSIDVMRVCTSLEINHYNVKTDRQKIINKICSILY